jgi:hypothetical protein
MHSLQVRALGRARREPHVFVRGQRRSRVVAGHALFGFGSVGMGARELDDGGALAKAQPRLGSRRPQGI